MGTKWKKKILKSKEIIKIKNRFKEKIKKKKKKKNLAEHQNPLSQKA
ncbi:unnamed protein product, partial [Vitis vinifera]